LPRSFINGAASHVKRCFALRIDFSAIEEIMARAAGFDLTRTTSRP
jgi:hypothetical protein